LNSSRLTTVAAGVVAVATLVAVALYFTVRRLPDHSAVFVLALTLLPSVPLLILDLAVRGLHSYGGPLGLSTQGRYILPALVGIDLAVARLLEDARTRRSARASVTAFRRAIPCVVVWAGLVSCVLAWRADLWWHNPGAPRWAAELVNAGRQPLVVADFHAIRRVASLSYQVGDHVRFLLVSPPDVGFPSGFSDIYIIPSREMERAALAAGCNPRPIRSGEDLWRVEPNCVPR